MDIISYLGLKLVIYCRKIVELKYSNALQQKNKTNAPQRKPSAAQVLFQTLAGIRTDTKESKNDLRYKHEKKYLSNLHDSFITIFI